MGNNIRKYSVLTIFIILFILKTNVVSADISRVWAVDDSEKIMKQDLTNPLATDSNNKVWDGQKIQLFGAKNEVVAFQLILQGGSSGTSNVNVSIPSLSSGSFSIDNNQAQNMNDPYNYVGKYIEFFTESYLNIDIRTGKCLVSGAWGYSGIQGNYLGWVPDALIPFQAPSGKGGAPFSISANSNQGVWVDIYIPKVAPAGTYNGEVKVSIDSNTAYTIPISLIIYDFALPDETHLKSSFWWGGYEANFVDRFGVTYRSSAYFPIESRYIQMFHRHRMNLLTNVDYSQMTTGTIPYKKYLIDGINSIFNKAYGYEGPGEGLGNRFYILGKYNSWRAGFPTAAGASYCKPCGANIPPTDGVCNTADWWQKQAACWNNWFANNAPNTDYALHMPPDEPLPAEYSSESNPFIQRFDWLDGTGLPRLGTMIGFPLGSSKTSENPYPSPYPYLTNNIDYWGVGTSMYYAPPGSDWGGQFGKYDGYVKSYVDYEHSLGKKVFIYNGALPWSGTAVIDTDATAFRVIPWVVWKYGVDLYSYYHVSDYTRYDASGQGQKSNPYVDNYKLYNSAGYGSACSPEGYKPNWGSGSLVYPGTDLLFPESSLGLTGPVASIRMKQWRRGEQDYEYLYIAKQAGYQNEVNNISNTVVPNALYDRNESSHSGWPNTYFRPPADWSNRGYGFENARKQLANLISPNQATPTPVPTLTPTPTPKPGDANGDNLVNEADYTIWLSHFGQTISGIANGDFSGDGQVDGIDYVLWINNYDT